MSQWFTVPCWFWVNAGEHMSKTPLSPYQSTAKARAGNAIKAHTQCPRTYKGHPGPCTDCLPPQWVGASVSPSYFIISATTKSSEPKKRFFFSYSLWYNMRFPCLFYVPGDKWWGKHFWSSFICQWQMQRFIWNTSKMEILTLSLQFRWKVLLPRWRVSLL